jgi:hypothetical protein
MNLQEQIGALETGIDHLNQLIQNAVAVQTALDAASECPPTQASMPNPQVATACALTAADNPATSAASPTPAANEAERAAETACKPSVLQLTRPAQNEIVLSIGGESISLDAEKTGQLIEELANARASMTPQPPMALPPGWPFVATKNPLMAVQKQSNGDRLLLLRHTGHGWVPYTLSPSITVQLYTLLTQG